MPAYLDHNPTLPMHADVAELEIEQRGHYLSRPRDVFEARPVTTPGSVVVGQQASCQVSKAMGVDGKLALNAVRVGFGKDKSLQAVEALFVKLQQLVNKLPVVMQQAEA